MRNDAEVTEIRDVSYEMRQRRAVCGVIPPRKPALNGDSRGEIPCSRPGGALTEATPLFRWGLISVHPKDTDSRS